MNVLIGAGVIGLLVAGILAGAFTSGDQNRANFYMESKEDRRARLKASGWVGSASLLALGAAAIWNWLV
ncbi:DUF5316 family protein [Paenibacillus aurantiacus]|uniref:DUF5316 family protein n=1 Tax=Paenibacillus aurantiacus TaxID=1936118 RepID=A0ABV5KQS2_9BACL